MCSSQDFLRKNKSLLGVQKKKQTDNALVNGAGMQLLVSVFVHKISLYLFMRKMFFSVTCDENSR